MNTQWFSDVLAQTILNLDPDENIIFVYDGAPAHHSPADPGQNTELKKLPPYSPFLSIVEQSICVFIPPIIPEWNTDPLKLIYAAQRCNKK